MTVVRGAELVFADLPGRRSADPLRGLDAGVLSVRVVELDADSRRCPHRHPHSSEVVYVVAGTGIAWQEGGSTRIGPGDTVIVPPGVPHATLPDEGQTMRLLCVFSHPDLGANLEELDEVIQL